jgi:predicted HTH transcriptional regulator
LPHFKNISEGFLVTVFTNEKTNVPVNVPEDRLVKILNLIKQDNSITIPKIANKLDVSSKTIKRDIQKLKNEGIIKRIGPDKGGKWSVL